MKKIINILTFTLLGMVAGVSILPGQSTPNPSQSDTVQKNPLLEEAQKFNTLGIELYDKGAYEEAVKNFEKALKINQEVLPPDHPRLAQAHVNLASLLDLTGQYEKAYTQFKQALNIKLLHFDPNALEMVELYNSLGLFLHDLGQYDSALMYVNAAREIWTQKHGESDLYTARLFHNSGLIRDSRGELRKAHDYYVRALEIKKDSLASSHPELAHDYNGLGIICAKQGDYDQAIDYYQQALFIWQNQLGEHHPILADVCDNLGNVYDLKGETGQAYVFMSRALEIKKQALDPNHPDIARSLNNLGVYFENMGKVEEAMNYHQEALRIRLHNLGRDHPAVANSLHNLGILLQRRGDYANALDHLQQGLAIRMRYAGHHHPLVSDSYREIGLTFELQYAYDRALTYYQRALATLYPELDTQMVYSNPKEAGRHTPVWTLKALHDKARALSKRHTRTRMREDLKGSLSTYWLALNLVDLLRVSYSGPGSKELLMGRSFQMYEEAIQVAWLLWEETADQAWLQQAFQIAEKSKAALLAENLRSSAASEFAGIPKQSLAFERQLNRDLAAYQKLIREKRTAGQMEDAINISYWQNRVFVLNRSRDSLISYFEQHYPEYFHLKYDLSVATIAEVQASLDNSTGLIEFFLSDSLLYSFMITGSKVLFHRTRVTRDFYAKIREMISLIRQPNPASDKDDAFSRFLSLGHDLYQILLKPGLDSTQIKNLVIVPDGLLGYLPFDLLLTSHAPQAKTYAALPYLMKTYTVRQAYSATLLKKKYRSVNSSAEGYSGFAPAYATSISRPSGSSFGELRYNQKEIESVARLVEGKSYLATAATEANFKAHAADFRLLHLAMHTLINDSLPLYSGLVFTADRDTAEDDFLYGYELYNLSLDAELVVLSACETGIGKIQRGEGIKSLARAFRYAGCPSIVMSLWQANDQSTADIMMSFFSNLKSGVSKSDALRAAKLDYLANVPRSRQHPFYWGTFVLVGDDRPVRLSDTNLWWVILLGISIAGIGIYLIRRSA